MDYIVHILEMKIKKCKDDSMKVNFYRTLMEYNLRLLTAVLWEIRKKSESTSPGIYKKWMHSLTRGSDGNFVTILQEKYNHTTGMNAEPSILNVFSRFLKERNTLQGHNTVDFLMIENLMEWENYYENLKTVSVSENDAYAQYQKSIFEGRNNLYYIRSVSSDGTMASIAIFEPTGADNIEDIPINTMSFFRNEYIQNGNLFILLNDSYFKLSPFIQYDEENENFMMFNGFDNGLIKYAYITRNSMEQCDFKYSNIPTEFENIVPISVKNDQRFETNRDLEIRINRFKQFQQYKRTFCEDIPLDAIDQLTEFLKGNNCFGAVRGQGGIGKTSIVFLWIQKIMRNRGNLLIHIRERFPLKQILFYSAKKKLYTNVGFESTRSDVNSYEDIIERLYYDLPLSRNNNDIPREEVVRSYLSHNVDREGVLIIIDDYESLDEISRNQLQNLKDIFAPSRTKLLITTRFLSSESKDILISRLDIKGCTNMTDYIFGSENWRREDGISPEMMYHLTEGIPLRIWYAKSIYQQRRLTHQTMKLPPNDEIESYLFNNFIDCFQDSKDNDNPKKQFIRNFLQVLCRYTQAQGSHSLTEISQFSSIFLSLENIKEYDAESPYFQYLIELKLLEERKESKSLDFSQLLSYISWQNAQKIRTETISSEQEILLNLTAYLDESQKQGCLAILNATNQLAPREREWILERLLKFNAVGEEDFSKVLLHIFQNKPDSDKLSIYQHYPKWFEQYSPLANCMLEYIQECPDSQLKEHGEIIKNFLRNAQQTIKDIAFIEVAFKIQLRLFAWLLDWYHTGNTRYSEFKDNFDEMEKILDQYLKEIPENSEFQKDKNNHQGYNDCLATYIG